MNAKLIITLIISVDFQAHSVTAQNVKRDLNENLFLIVEGKIKPGQFEKILNVAKEMSEKVKARNREP